MSPLMKKNAADIVDGLKIWTKYSLFWILIAFIMRIGFFFVMKSAGFVDWASFLTIISGVYFDLTVVWFWGMVLLIPLLIINKISKKAANIFSVIFITIYAIVYGCLIGYYSNVNLPLDRVFLVYSLAELYDVVVSSVNFSLLPVVFVLLIVALYVVLVRFWIKKISFSSKLSLIYFAIVVLFVIVFNYNSLINNDKNYKTYQKYCLAVNQLAYTLNDFYLYRNTEEVPADMTEYDENVLVDATNYQRLFPDYQYVDIRYPFMRKADDPDVLGGFMNPTTDGKAPDFVFVIIESLGQRLSSVRPKMSFTPFIDDLKKESLYWPNCLALAERTFGAVPNIFSSAPYDKTGFARVWFPIPDHNSILKDMAKNGYSLSFYYGGNASFDGQNEYMQANGVSYIMDPNEVSFDQEQKENLKNANSWGMYDRDMFNAAFQHRDTTVRNRPNTDIFITLSTHEPHYFKGIDEYIKKVEKMVEETKSFGPSEKNIVLENKNIYACFLYMDDCIKQLFDYYKSQPEFENTVFVLVGDHRMGRVYVNASPLLKYNVPLIVYSPLLKKSESFKGVVTHHDIAPTITSYLSNNYDYQTDDLCHWLGTSLDTSSSFRCRQSVSFMRNSRDENEFLHNNYFIERDRLFEISDSLYVDEIQNDEIRDSLVEYLRRYKNVDWYVTQNDFLIKKPNEVVPICNLFSDATNVEKMSNGTYYSMMKPLMLNQNFERIYVDFEFDYKNDGSIDIDKVTGEFRADAGNFYKGYKFSNLSTDPVDGYSHYRMRTTFFLGGNDTENSAIKIDVFSQTEFDFEYKNLKIKVEGLPRIKNH